MRKWDPMDFALLILTACLGLSIVLMVAAVLAVVMGR